MPVERFTVSGVMPVGVLVVVFVLAAIAVAAAVALVRAQPRRPTWRRDVGVLLAIAVLLTAGTTLFFADDRRVADERRAATVAAIEDYYEIDVTEVIAGDEDTLRFAALDEGAAVECVASRAGDTVMLVCDP